MSKAKQPNTLANKISKRTCQGGKVKTSSMNKSQKKGFKRYVGQGR